MSGGGQQQSNFGSYQPSYQPKMNPWQSGQQGYQPFGAAGAYGTQYQPQNPTYNNYQGMPQQQGGWMNNAPGGEMALGRGMMSRQMYQPPQDGFALGRGQMNNQTMFQGGAQSPSGIPVEPGQPMGGQPDGQFQLGGGMMKPGFSGPTFGPPTPQSTDPRSFAPPVVGQDRYGINSLFKNGQFDRGTAVNNYYGALDKLRNERGPGQYNLFDIYNQGGEYTGPINNAMIADLGGGFVPKGDMFTGVRNGQYSFLGQPIDQRQFMERFKQGV